MPGNSDPKAGLPQPIGGTRLHIALRESIDRPGGLNTYVKLLARGQIQLGYNVKIAHSISRAGTYETQSSYVEREPTKALSAADVVHMHMAYSARAFRRREENRKLVAAAINVVHFHGPWYAEGQLQGDSALRGLIKRLYETREYRRHAIFVSDSRAFGSMLSSRFQIPEGQVQVVYPGVDTDRFVVGDKQAARHMLGLPNDAFTFACVRRLEPRMGIDRALKALVTVPGARLLIAGSGSQRDALQSLAGQLGLRDRVVFLGHVTDLDLPTIYQAADVAVVPTVGLEGYGMVVLEAMACGTPVIATSTGGLPEAMGPFVEGWVVPPNDVPALADRMNAARNEMHSPQTYRTYSETRSPIRMAIEIGQIVQATRSQQITSEVVAE